MSAHEVEILGALFDANGDVWPPMVAKLIQNAPESFDDLRHGKIAVAIRESKAKGEPVSRLDVGKKLDFEGALLYVDGLEGAGLDLAESRAESIWKSFQQKKFKSVLDDGLKAMEADPTQVDSIAANVSRSVGMLKSEDAGTLVDAKPIGELILPVRESDLDEILMHRFLCRGGGMLWVGPTGVGKSTSVMQAAFCWCIGREAFGIKPKRPIRILIFQAENDDGDMAEFRDGIAAGLELTADKREICFQNVLVLTEYRLTGKAFCDEVIAPQIRKHKPDLIIIDPALAYIGGNNLTQEAVGTFLRNYLNPVIKAGTCAVIIVHHTNKPPAGEKSQWQSSDFAYLGAGSAEWANWARAVLAIQNTSARGIFKLHAAKRSGRIGWKDASGARVYEKLIAHAKEPGRIHWRECDESELPTKGRPKNQSKRAKVLALLPAHGLTNPEWEELADKEESIPRSTYREIRDELSESGAVIRSVNGKWMPSGEKGEKWRK